MTTRSKRKEQPLSYQDRARLKAIWLDLWARRGEGENDMSGQPEVADLWYEAVITLLIYQKLLPDDFSYGKKRGDDEP